MQRNGTRKKQLKCPTKKGSNFLVFKNNKYESSSDGEYNDHKQGNNQGNMHSITEGNFKEEKYQEHSEESEEEFTVKMKKMVQQYAMMMSGNTKELDIAR